MNSAMMDRIFSTYDPNKSFHGFFLASYHSNKKERKKEIQQGHKNEEADLDGKTRLQWTQYQFQRAKLAQVHISVSPMLCLDLSYKGHRLKDCGAIRRSWEF